MHLQGSGNHNERGAAWYTARLTKGQMDSGPSPAHFRAVDAYLIGKLRSVRDKARTGSTSPFAGNRQ